MKESIDETDHVKYTDVSISKSDETTKQQHESQEMFQINEVHDIGKNTKVSIPISDTTISETQVSSSTTQDSLKEYTIAVPEEEVALIFEKYNLKTNQDLGDDNDQMEDLSNSVSSMNVSDNEHNDIIKSSEKPVVIAKEKEVFKVPKKLLLQPPSHKVIHVQKILERTCTSNFYNFNESPLESNTNDYCANACTNKDLEDTVDQEEDHLCEGNQELKKFIQKYKFPSLELLKHGKSLE